MLSSYKTLDMETVKRYLINDISDYIVQNVCFSLCNAGMCGYSHIIFEHSYAKTSKRRIFAMDDSIDIVLRVFFGNLGTTMRK